MSKKLTAKQQRFVDEYLVDLNATQAAIRAGYSKKTAHAIGEENLRKPEIQAALQERMKARQERTEITQDAVLKELARIAFFDPRKLFRPDGSPKPINELDDDTAAALAGMEVLEEFEGTGKDRVFIGYTKKYKIADKNSALTNAMRHLGMLNDKMQLTGKDGGPIQQSNVTPEQLAEAVRSVRDKF
jgi:phage terminase small subunit